MLHAKWFLRTQAVHGIYAMRQAGRQADGEGTALRRTSSTSPAPVRAARDHCREPSLPALPPPAAEAAPAPP